MLRTTTPLVICVLSGLSLFQDLSGQQQKSVQEPIFSMTENTHLDGWIQLFDGNTLYGWKAASQVDWKVQNGAIVATSGKQGLLRTTSQFDDFQLCLEFRCGEDTNSGIFLRTSPQPRDPTQDCYEINIAPEANPFPTGSLVGRKKKQVQPDFDHQPWHRIHIITNGNTIRATIDDEEPFTYIDPQHLGRGYVGLQFNQGKIEFRNIFLRPLNLESMIDKDLSQWNDGQSMDSRFQVDSENTLNVSGGRGQLESRRAYDDFVFSMHCKTNAAGLNSGVFYRCIPGELMNGYESQIQNEFLNDDREQPKDCGTGGIFRRTEAKRIVANDQEWFSKTIITHGAHVSVWVNGIQVTDWTDNRSTHENPRRGRRLEAGSIILQGHDPTTDIDFGQLEVKALTERWDEVP